MAEVTTKTITCIIIRGPGLAMDFILYKIRNPARAGSIPYGFPPLKIRFPYWKRRPGPT
jgi:hypothetical protein